MSVVFRRSKLFTETLAKHKDVGGRVADFIRHKASDPLSPFGGKDTHFVGAGPLGQEKIIHAHLTRDISLLYKRSGKNPTIIDLIAIASHADTGTGTPANPKTQKSLAKKVSDMTFESANRQIR